MTAVRSPPWRSAQNAAVASSSTECVLQKTTRDMAASSARQLQYTGQRRSRQYAAGTLLHSSPAGGRRRSMCRTTLTEHGSKRAVMSDNGVTKARGSTASSRRRYLDRIRHAHVAVYMSIGLHEYRVNSSGSHAGCTASNTGTGTTITTALCRLRTRRNGTAVSRTASVR